MIGFEVPDGLKKNDRQLVDKPLRKKLQQPPNKYEHSSAKADATN